MPRKQIIDLAVQTAKQSTHTQKLAAVIFNRKSVISYSCNYPESHRKKLHPKFSRYPTSIHAEVAAIIKARSDLKGCSLLVVRINKKNQLLLARPCSWCFDYICHVGIKKLFYSISNYPYIEESKIKRQN